MMFLTSSIDEWCLTIICMVPYYEYFLACVIVWVRVVEAVVPCAGQDTGYRDTGATQQGAEAAGGGIYSAETRGTSYCIIGRKEGVAQVGGENSDSSRSDSERVIW